MEKPLREKQPPKTPEQKLKDALNLEKALHIWGTMKTNLEEFLKEFFKEYYSSQESEDLINYFNKLKKELGWEKLPYNNLEKLIDEINHPKNIGDKARELLILVGKPVYKMLLDLEEFLNQLDDKSKRVILKNYPNHRDLFFISFYRQNFVLFSTKYKKD